MVLTAKINGIKAPWLFVTVFALCCFLFCPLTHAQQGVSINPTGSPADPSAMLDVSSLSKGLLIPRVSLASINDITTIPNPATSLLVYNTNAGMTGGAVGFWYYDGSVWAQAIGPQGIQGIPGQVGATGAQGMQGPTGATGAQGIQGPTGTTGAQGLQGPTGATGAQGAPGPTGEAGAQGLQGNTGATGPQGVPGQMGGPIVGQTYFSSGSWSRTTSGTTTFTVPAGITIISVSIAGGGGGGGYNGSTPTSGGFGGFVFGQIAVIPGENLTITVGAGGTGYSSGTNYGRYGSGSSITRASNSTLLAAAGGGGGGSSDGNSDGVGGGAAYGTTINGTNGTWNNGGSGGNNYIAYLYSGIAFKGANYAGGVAGPISGMTSVSFTSFNNGQYGWGGYYGNGNSGAVFINY